MSSLQEQGYELQLIEPLPERLKCSLCGKLMKKPLQTCRGEIACYSCYYDRKGDSNICPIDGEEIDPNLIFLDRAKEREINALTCYCLYRTCGCKWNGTVKTHVAHQEICKYRPVNCMFCSEEISHNLLDQHLQQCLAVNQSKECPYNLLGCSFIPNAEEDLKMHLVNNIYVHSSMMIKEHQQTKDEMIQMRNEIDRLRQHEEANNQHKAHITAKVVKLEGESNQVSDKFAILEKNQSLLSTKVLKLESAKNAPSKSGEGSFLSSNIYEELSEKLKKHQKEIHQLSNTITNISQNLSDVDLRHQLHENTIYNGHMIWKIDNYEHRYQQALIGKTTALHSAPSFTEKYGYKFCARLYLNGDGMGKGTHMSLFFVLMKSEFDNLLQWPFERNVSFTLLNQENSDHNIKETFHTEPNSSSFKKPVKQMNIASGCPFFITQEKLRKPGSGFIKDDCFFIEIKVKKP